MMLQFSSLTVDVPLVGSDLSASSTLCSSSVTRVNWCSGRGNVYILAPTWSLPSSEVNGEASSSVGVQLRSYWREIGRMKTLPQFPHLTSFAKCVLSLPVSNADTERVFSNVRKNCDRLSNWNGIEYTMCTTIVQTEQQHRLLWTWNSIRFSTEC